MKKQSDKTIIKNLRAKVKALNSAVKSQTIYIKKLSDKAQKYELENRKLNGQLVHDVGGAFEHKDKTIADLRAKVAEINQRISMQNYQLDRIASITRERRF